MKTLRTGRNVIVEIKYTIRVSNSLLKMASSREVNFATNYEAKHKSPEQFCEVEKSLEVTTYTIFLTIL